MTLTELPPAPDYLQNYDEVKAEWTRAGTILLGLGQLDEKRLGYLGMYCAFFGAVIGIIRAGSVPPAEMLEQLRLMRASYEIPALPPGHPLH